MIQTKGNNTLDGGTEKEYIAYNFTGQPLQKKHIHAATGKTTQTELYTYAYDDALRLKTTQYSLNGGTMVMLVSNTYDELGRLLTTQHNGQSSLKTTYAYNVRSWLKSSSSPLFNQTLYYNDTYAGSTARYNGNISAMSWKMSNETPTRGYKFSYDNLSRLTAANYLENGSTNDHFNTAYAYDKQGNMTSLSRRGNTGTATYGNIDVLTMTYAGNQLVKAEDGGSTVSLSSSMDFKNNSNATLEYSYDANGNLTQDLNKGISSITYNLLNLPQTLSISNSLGSATNSYTYAADGRKLKAVIGSKTTEYCGNVIYENGVLKRILIEGGYIEGGTYYFYLQDHLGNNRVVADANGNIKQTNHYYPFGMSFAEGTVTSSQPYKYNGKELDTDRGLNLYDYSARYMDPALGRFNTVDPMAEKYYSISPYVYVGNNPMNRIDINGDTISTVVTTMVDGVATNTTYYYGQNAQGNYGFIDSNGQMYSGDNEFVNGLTTALGELRGGANGAELVEDLMGSKGNVRMVAGGSNRADPEGKYIFWNSTSINGGPAQDGSSTRPTYIGLGHEMAHIQDVWNGTYDKNSWVGVIQNAEKYATHVENLLRTEHGLPLRTNYGITPSGMGDPSTQILYTGTRNSLFFKGTTTIKGRIYPGLPYTY